jgi:hypothetical protein
MAACRGIRDLLGEYGRREKAPKALNNGEPDTRLFQNPMPSLNTLGTVKSMIF